MTITETAHLESGQIASQVVKRLNGLGLDRRVEVLAGERVVASEARDNRRALKTAAGREIVVDGMVAGIGLEPNIELAKAAGLMTEDGIVVDEFLRTRSPDIYAAGDVAAFHSPLLGKRIRVEHEDNANSRDERRAGTWRA